MKLTSIIITCVGLTAAGIGVGSRDTEAAAPPPVQVRHETLTLPWYTAVQGYEQDPRQHSKQKIVPGSRMRIGTREQEAIILENEYLRLTILPEMGGAMARAIYKPTGDDLFFW